jgi:RNA polymerase sigma-70 factor (ECF subfamily)
MAIVLHHLCDLSIEQVASETGAPVGTVKARLSRGRTALARVLSEDPADLAGSARPSGFAGASGKGEREDDRVR